VTALRKIPENKGYFELIWADFAEFRTKHNLLTLKCPAQTLQERKSIAIFILRDCRVRIELSGVRFYLEENEEFSSRLEAIAAYYSLGIIKALAFMKDSNTLIINSQGDDSYARPVTCLSCNKTMRMSSLKRHVGNKHPNEEIHFETAPLMNVPKTPQVPQIIQVPQLPPQQKLMAECPCCGKTISRKHLRRHVTNIHPESSQAKMKPLSNSDFISERNSAKRHKPQEEDECFYSDEEPERLSLKCECGATFPKLIYIQVHATLFHKSFSTLLRCEVPGCIGLFLNKQLWAIHRQNVHRHQ
jgi:hypothetical protein